MKNIKLTEFILKNEKFYKCLTKSEKEIVNNLTELNINLTVLPLYQQILLDKDGNIDDMARYNNDTADIQYIFVGSDDEFNYFYRAEVKEKYLFMSFGRLVACKKISTEFNINNYILQ